LEGGHADLTKKEFFGPAHFAHDGGRALTAMPAQKHKLVIVGDGGVGTWKGKSGRAVGSVTGGGGNLSPVNSIVRHFSVPSMY
jgi:hypothetical protein